MAMLHYEQAHGFSTHSHVRLCTTVGIVFCDKVGICSFNIQPERRSSVLMSVYYILFMLFGSVFLSQAQI